MAKKYLFWIPLVGILVLALAACGEAAAAPKAAPAPTAQAPAPAAPQQTTPAPAVQPPGAESSAPLSANSQVLGVQTAHAAKGSKTTLGGIPSSVQNTAGYFSIRSRAVFTNQTLHAKWVNFIEEKLPFVAAANLGDSNTQLTYLDYQEKEGAMVIETLICYGMPSAPCSIGKVRVEITLEEVEGGRMKVSHFEILEWQYFGP